MNRHTTHQRCSEDGYELWLRYPLIADVSTLATYRAALAQVMIDTGSATMRAARDEITRGLAGLLGSTLPLVDRCNQPSTLVIGTPRSNPVIAALGLDQELERLGDEGYILARATFQAQNITAIAANTDIGVLYGVFHFLRHLQTGRPLDDLPVTSAPRVRLRMLNHWDNMDRTIERGYAGFSLWDWHKLPNYVAPQITDYARANASVGINGTVLTNVNSSTLMLTRPYLLKAAALADVLRPYGVRVYLSARFSAPIDLDKLPTADPLDADVAAWWKAKAAEIYSIIPDFGGFLVKANSEGQPGPHDYGRSHAEGANVLADALAPWGGVVVWRAFVYDEHCPEDRAKQAYSDLVPQDGTFRPNVLLQAKNGPIDFQPREPYHPLFGAMPHTPLMLEVQLTQEYLGCATHLVYLAPLFKEVLDADTYCQGPGSLVAQVVDGSLDGHALSGIAGVSNIGSERTWCGHPFAAANWFAFGRLAWDHRAAPEDIAGDWLRMTFTTDPRFVDAAQTMMIASREAVVDYMTPLGLHHIMARDHHYGPGPWVDGGRADWTSVYYHRADREGLGFDRTPTGSDAVSQYFPPSRDQLAGLDTCPENLLLWFHHVPWQHRLKSGHTLWDELCLSYQRGVDSVRQMQQTWVAQADAIDAARFEHVRALLAIQESEARWWRDACLLYFQTFSQLPIPPQVEPPAESLDYYRQLTHYYVPGIRERRLG